MRPFDCITCCLQNPDRSIAPPKPSSKDPTPHTNTLKTQLKPRTPSPLLRKRESIEPRSGRLLRVCLDFREWRSSLGIKCKRLSPNELQGTKFWVGSQSHAKCASSRCRRQVVGRTRLKSMLDDTTVLRAQIRTSTCQTPAKEHPIKPSLS